jgi:2-keto-3-deoxy-L-rhamnonate aldolase RhmA
LVRGHSGPIGGTDYNAGIADKAAYYSEANEQMLVCALVEDVAVLNNLDAILAVPGIDLYSIGPIVGTVHRTAAMCAPPMSQPSEDFRSRSMWKCLI